MGLRDRGLPGGWAAEGTAGSLPDIPEVLLRNVRLVDRVALVGRTVLVLPGPLRVGGASR